MNRDIAFEILFHLDDYQFIQLCKTNTFFNDICNDPLLWIKKINHLNVDFPTSLSLTPIEWKNVYYKIKNNDLNAIVTWSKINHFHSVMVWLEQYYIEKIKTTITPIIGPSIVNIRLDHRYNKNFDKVQYLQNLLYVIDIIIQNQTEDAKDIILDMPLLQIHLL